MKKNNLLFEDSVLKKAIALELNNVDGIIGFEKGFFQKVGERVDNEKNITTTGDITKGISIEQRDEEVSIFCNVVADYEVEFPQIFEQAKSRLEKLLTKKFDLTLSDFYLNIVDLKTAEEQKNDYENYSEEPKEQEKESSEDIVTNNDQKNQTESEEDLNEKSTESEENGIEEDSEEKDEIENENNREEE
ncbi:hypothetical protein IGJ68_002123 [Enterococcus sp. DIV0564]|uniref:Asp23/Gls24 family envelope stress response protein n=1 Tax=Enterococcus TaxID=1350 RepID=UPI001A979C80|nr:Asp23/Gls24 family envelope stress response protein [Enterococcus faecalis]